MTTTHIPQPGALPADPAEVLERLIAQGRPGANSLTNAGTLRGYNKLGLRDGTACALGQCITDHGLDVVKARPNELGVLTNDGARMTRTIAELGADHIAPWLTVKVARSMMIAHDNATARFLRDWAPTQGRDMTLTEWVPIIIEEWKRNDLPAGGR